MDGGCVSRKAVEPSEKIIALFMDLDAPQQSLLLSLLSVVVRRHSDTVSERDGLPVTKRKRKADARLPLGTPDPRD